MDAHAKKVNEMASKTDVIPIMIPNIAWERYIKDAADLTGHSPTFNIDNSTVSLSPFARYIVSLEEFFSGKTTPALSVLRNEINTLNHLFFSFMVHSSYDSVFKIMSTTNLDVLSTAAKKKKDRVTVLSGTLRQWREAMVTVQESKETRLIFNKCFAFFMKLGLGNIWDNYRKLTLEDETFLLEYKK